MGLCVSTEEGAVAAVAGAPSLARGGGGKRARATATVAARAATGEACCAGACGDQCRCPGALAALADAGGCRKCPCPAAKAPLAPHAPADGDAATAKAGAKPGTPCPGCVCCAVSVPAAAACAAALEPCCLFPGAGAAAGRHAGAGPVAPCSGTGSGLLERSGCLAPAACRGAGDAGAIDPLGNLHSMSSDDSCAAHRVRFSADTPVATCERARPEAMTASDSISLKKVVDVFYERVLSDKVLLPFFSLVDMTKLKSHQVKFMALAFGGRDLVFDECPNLNLRRIHWRLIRDRGLTEDHWELFFGHFCDALDSLPEIPLDTKLRAIASVRTTRVYFTPITPEEEVAGGFLVAPPRPRA